ncbi:MAG TPA: hypothetical protein VFX60_05145, partial [Micromonospora sp.]|nr:hypothetical protein [Micromonospora sp.]
LARPYGRLQLRGTFLSLWDDILPPIPESVWRENLALVAAWLAEFGGRPLAEPPRIQWQAPSSLSQQPAAAERSDQDPSKSLAESPTKKPAEKSTEIPDEEPATAGEEESASVTGAPRDATP